jgi:hypothetical protein
MKPLLCIVLLTITLVGCNSTADEEIPKTFPAVTVAPATNTPEPTATLEPTADHAATSEAQEEIVLQEMGDVFQSVCESGGGHNAAAPYSQTSGTHPAYSILVIPSSYEISESTKNVVSKIVSRLQERSYAATSIEETELVICIKPLKYRLVEICKYNDGSAIVRAQRQLGLTIVEAKTGQQVFTTKLEGSDPKSCPSSKPTSAADNIIGEIQMSTVRKAVEAYTNVP